MLSLKKSLSIAGIAMAALASATTTQAAIPDNAYCATGPAITQIPQIECEALVAFYTSTNGRATWDAAAGGNQWDTANPINTWQGVTITVGNVTRLQLAGFNLSSTLSGTLPPELGNLSSLQALYLIDNQLTGAIPASLGNLGSLLSLTLQNNQLSGVIPSSLGSLMSLEYLDLSENQLTGNIPPSLGGLDNLIVLYLYSNQLNGAIPSELGDLDNLAELDLAVNQLSGPVPNSLTTMMSLTDLYLHDNHLSGDLVAQFMGAGLSDFDFVDQPPLPVQAAGVNSVPTLPWYGLALLALGIVVAARQKKN